MKKITEKTNLTEILNNPKLVEVLEKYHFPCLTCPFAKMEIENLEIGKICDLYGIEIKKVLKDLNEAIKDEKRNN
jgi:hypothetical protein